MATDSLSKKTAAVRAATWIKLFERLRYQEVVGVRTWTRDELYDRAS